MTPLQDLEKQVKFLTDELFTLKERIQKLENFRQSLNEWAEENAE